MPTRSAWVRVWLAVGILFLLTVQPDGWRPWGVLAAAVLADARRMLRRLSAGEVIDPEWTTFSQPTYYFAAGPRLYVRKAEAAPDRRLDEAIALVRSKRDASGRWPLENPHPGAGHFPLDEGEGAPSLWNTLRALRVLRWYDRAGTVSRRSRMP
jgi:hypothetical protein